MMALLFLPHMGDDWIQMDKIRGFGYVRHIILEVLLSHYFPDKDGWWRDHQEEYVNWNPRTQDWGYQGPPLFRHQMPDLVPLLKEFYVVAQREYVSHVFNAITDLVNSLEVQNIPCHVVSLPREVDHYDLRGYPFLTEVKYEEGPFRVLSSPEEGRFVAGEFPPLGPQFWERVLPKIESLPVLSVSI